MSKETKMVETVEFERIKDLKRVQMPEGMTHKDLRKWSERVEAAESREVAHNYSFDAFPLDGVVALMDVLAEIYGWVDSIPTPSFWGDNPPTMIGVPVGQDEVRQVPWGRIQVPGITGYLETSLSNAPGEMPKFVLQGVTLAKDKPQVLEIVGKVRERLAVHSIYRGKAFKLDLEWLREEERFHPIHHAPQFVIPAGKVSESDLVLPDDVARDVQVGLFAPIEYSEDCRRAGINLHRGALLAGPYGTGKTLSAYVLAGKCVEHGWTFLYVSSVLDLAAAFQFAAQYAPCVVFAEDVDQVTSGERDDDMNTVLNLLDGVDTKNREIFTVLTTNHVDQICQAMLRPGRIDTLIHFTPPDDGAAARLVQHYGRGLIDSDADFAKIGKALAGHLAAEVSEAVQRAKLATISRLRRGDGMPRGGIKGHVNELDILDAVRAMDAQHRLLEPKPEEKPISAREAVEMLGSAIGRGAADEVSGLIREATALPPALARDGEALLGLDD